MILQLVRNQRSASPIDNPTARLHGLNHIPSSILARLVLMLMAPLLSTAAAHMLVATIPKRVVFELTTSNRSVLLLLCHICAMRPEARLSVAQSD
jgi:hypothetical protein